MSDIQPTHEIPYVSPSLSLRGRVAIVGASGNLTNSSFGELIDSYDEVVRFNRSPTEGFEKDVGSKTSLRVVNNHVFNNNDISAEGYTNSPPNFVRNLRDSRIMYVAPDLGPWHMKDRNTHPSNNLYLYQYNTISELKKFLKCNFPQNLLVGSIGVGLCVKAGLKPTLFGFDTEPIPRTHYYQDRPKKWNDVAHNPSQEQKMLLHLESKGLISIK